MTTKYLEMSEHNPHYVRRSTHDCVDTAPEPLDEKIVLRLSRRVTAPTQLCRSDGAVKHKKSSEDSPVRPKSSNDLQPEQPKLRLRFDNSVPAKKSKSSSPRPSPRGRITSPRASPRSSSSAARLRRGSYSGDPLEPNLTARSTDPVHKRPKSLKHSPILTTTESMKEIQEEEIFDYKIILPTKQPKLQFSHNNPSVENRYLQWVHLSCKGEAPSERIYHDSDVIGKKFYVTFGTDGETIMNQIYSLDLATYKWEKLNPLGRIPSHRYGHTCTAISKQLLIFGGRNKQFVLADMQIYNSIENRWYRISVNPPLPARAYHKAYYHKEFIYFIGGIDCSGKTVSKVIKFHLETKTWKLVTFNGFKGRARFALLELGEAKVGLIGGCKSNKSLFNSGGKYLKDMLIIDVVYETTIIREKISPMLRLVNLTAIAKDSNILVYGGYNQRKQATAELKLMTVKDNMWSAGIVVPRGTRPPDLEGHTMNSFRHGVVMFGGQEQEKGLSSACYMLQIGSMRAKDAPSSVDLFASLVRPIREKFLKKAKKISVVEMKNISNEEQIARGASGTVSKALLNNRYVVLKEFTSTDEEIFQAEVNLLAGLYHPNIVECLGVVRQPRQLIVLEYAPLGDLFKFCQKQQESFGWPLIMSFAINIAQGMRHLHSHNIFHRDLKSLNVLVFSTDPKASTTAKIVDFGESEETFEYRAANELCGTVRWTAPEIFAGEPFTPKADVFSYGIILWEIISLETPYSKFKRDYMVEDFVVGGGRPDIPSDCLAGYRTLIHSCWNEKPQARPTFEEILNVLTELKARLPAR